MDKTPRFDIDLESFWQDPYPALAELQARHAIAFVPQLDSWLMTRRDDIDHWEKQIDLFSSEQPGGLMTELMGQNMMRKDGAAHQNERRQMQPAVAPRTTGRIWHAAFQKAADALLAEMQPGQVTDICRDYALLLSGEALRLVTGLSNITAREMDACSQAMIDGIANYKGDAAVRQRCLDAVDKLDQAIDDMAGQLAANPPDADDPAAYSILAVLRRAECEMEMIRSNIKLAISGGQNEPRDAIAGAVWALLTHPEQLALLEAGEVSWGHAFEEFVRWISPIGMSPRRIARDAELEGAQLKEGDRAFFMFGAANRDPRHFEQADRFDITRSVKKHIAFGAGPHFCAGAFVSRALVAGVGLPSLFQAFPDMQLVNPEAVRFGGWAFRGPLKMEIRL
jgi:cytochrome P450